ncbi:MAG: GNAT family N-acetyltransferase [Clostridia bacterium]|nr:GNAT family N-acetyltransferase [Clostridia bacterium]
MIEFKETKLFSKEAVVELFKSVNWPEANYPDKLFAALQNSETVICAFDGEKLVGLIRVLDDGEIFAIIHFLLVNPNYQGMHIASDLVKLAKEKYKDIMYFKVVPIDEGAKKFYLKQGFKESHNADCLIISNIE